MKKLSLLLAVVFCSSAYAQLAQYVPRREYQTRGAMSLYVDPVGGSDSNPCTQSRPCLTTKAAYALIPMTVRHPVTVNFLPGNVAGAALANRSFDPVPGQQAYIKLQCSLGTVTPTTGPGVFTVSSAAVATATSSATVTATTSTWTAHDSALKGQLACWTAGNSLAGSQTNLGKYPCAVITDNTSNTLTTAGYFFSSSRVPGPGATVTIETWQTFFTTSAPGWQGASPYEASTPGSFYGLLFEGVRSLYDQLQIVGCGFNITTGFYPIHFTGSGSHLSLWNNYFTGPNAFVHVFTEGGTNLEAWGNAFSVQPGLGTQSIYVSTQGFTSSSAARLTLLDLQNNFWFSPSSQGGYGIICDRCYIKAQGNIFQNLSRAYWVGSTQLESYLEQYSNLGLGVSFSLGNNIMGLGFAWLSGFQCQNVGTCIRQAQAGYLQVDCGSPGTGTGNTQAFQLDVGALGKIGICSGTNVVTGGTDIAIGGSTYTYAQLRAASPKLLTDTLFGTTILQQN